MPIGKGGQTMKDKKKKKKNKEENPCMSCGYCRFYVETGKWHCDESGVEIDKIPKNFCFMNEI